MRRTRKQFLHIHGTVKLLDVVCYDSPMENVIQKAQRLRQAQRAGKPVEMEREFDDLLTQLSYIGCYLVDDLVFDDLDIQ